MKLDTVLLMTVFPCCRMPAHLRALVDIPKETYYRSCYLCRSQWKILRTCTRAHQGVRFDRLEWECLRGSVA